MRTVIRVIYDIAFIIALLIGHLFKGIVYVLSLLGLKLQEVSFGVSKANLKRRQQDEFRRINDRHTKIHLKELADLLETELSKYQQDIDSQKFYRLKGLIKKSLDKGDLKKLTIFYTILFETPKNKVLTELYKLLTSDR